MGQELAEDDILVVNSGRLWLPLEEAFGVNGRDLNFVATNAHLNLSSAAQFVDCGHVIRAIERCFHRKHV